MSAKKTDSASSTRQKLDLISDKLPREPDGFVLFAFRCKDSAVLNKVHTLFHSYAGMDATSIPQFPFLGKNGRQLVKGRDGGMAVSYYSEADEPDVCYLILKNVNSHGASLSSVPYPGNIERSQKPCLELLLADGLITPATSERAIGSNRKKIKGLWAAHDTAAEGAKQVSVKGGAKKWGKEMPPDDEGHPPGGGTALRLPPIIHLFPRPGDDGKKR